MSQQAGRGWCPFAIHKPIPETYTQNAITPRISILHSAGGSAELYGWWMNPSSKGLECHGFVDDECYIDPADGLEYAKLYQYVNIFVQADANREANDIAVSTETASTVHAAEPWSAPQVRTLIRWQTWVCQEAPAIKAQLCPSPRGSGIGWHVMFGAPGPWTPARGKVCPGPARIRQVPEIIAAVQRNLTHPTPQPEQVPQEDDMARAYRIPNGEVWICTGTHREHVNGTTLNERAVLGLVAPVPADAKDRDDRYPGWVRKTNAQGEKILRQLKA